MGCVGEVGWQSLDWPRLYRRGAGQPAGRGPTRPAPGRGGSWRRLPMPGQERPRLKPDCAATVSATKSMTARTRARNGAGRDAPPADVARERGPAVFQPQQLGAVIAKKAGQAGHAGSGAHAAARWLLISLNSAADGPLAGDVQQPALLRHVGKLSVVCDEGPVVGLPQDSGSRAGIERERHLAKLANQVAGLSRRTSRSATSASRRLSDLRLGRHGQLDRRMRAAKIRQPSRQQVRHQHRRRTRASPPAIGSWLARASRSKANADASMAWACSWSRRPRGVRRHRRGRAFDQGRLQLGFQRARRRLTVAWSTFSERAAPDKVPSRATAEMT